MTDYSYDLADQLNDLHHQVLPSTNISRYQYPLYDGVGNRKQMDKTLGTNSPESTLYGYNDVYELTTVTGNQNHGYIYDAVGNRTTADTIPYTPNPLNQYSSVNGVNYSYDNNGNLISDGTRTFVYDRENRLLTSADGTNSANYGYDALNRRVRKTVDAAPTYFVYDGDQIIQDRATGGTINAEYTFGNGIDEVLTMDRGGVTYYYHSDGLGSLTEVTDASGNLVESYEYDSYGQPSIFGPGHEPRVTSHIDNRFMFTGQEFDAESGLYHFNARTYSSQLGRFLQRDPVGYFDSMNLYSYVDSVGKPTAINPNDFTNLYNFVGNNPVNYTDPLGLYKYSTTNTGIAFLHESNPFNTDGAFYQQATSMGSFFGGDLAGAAATSGQSIVEQTNTECKDSGWQAAYTGAQITAGIAALTAGSLIAVEAGTAIRIEVHGTHGGRVLPHLQGIKGPGWGKTLWRFPSH